MVAAEILPIRRKPHPVTPLKCPTKDMSPHLVSNLYISTEHWLVSQTTDIYAEPTVQRKFYGNFAVAPTPINTGILPSFPIMSLNICGSYKCLIASQFRTIPLLRSMREERKQIFESNQADVVTFRLRDQDIA
ncbi:hypothetical protein AVEN_35859-1 [Araneus ventricosus]|uniref:Uncharacterized protein n=1 Tax=Araneus ventricosus TaxID=182803 RepID=A0A4Y2BJ83_ARAVE|nr:hypothetical protein AVEN_35859-1 [Araneus ventricosus]